ncbi:MAG: enterotoxin [Bacteroidota bacterium]|nr:enterotoxin [Bacteroidota bacterium]
MKKSILLTLICLSAVWVLKGQPAYPGHLIGTAKVFIERGKIVVENNSLVAQWSIKNNVLCAVRFFNNETKQSLSWNDNSWFSILLKNGERLTSKEFAIATPPKIKPVLANQKSIKRSCKDNGKQIVADFYCKKAKLKLHWKAVLRDNSNYIRQEFTVEPEDSLNIDEISLIEIPQESGVKSYGQVAGSPLVAEDMFFAFEHPMSHVASVDNNSSLYVKRYSVISPSTTLSFSTVWGVAPSQQLRRAFLYYVERERAVPYHQLLHYNSWFDISFGDRKLNEASCMDRMKVFTDSLIEKRHVQMQAFLFDDGWDNNKTLWQFNDGFPNGFSRMEKFAQKNHANLGVWVSPFGGYGEAKEQRLEYGKSQNPPYETNENGFSLSGPVYFKCLRDALVKFVKNYGVTIFKVDGVGEGNGTEGSNLRYEKDIDALLRLVEEVRSVKPDVYFSLTTGTWASPYWLFYGDAIWRNGGDTELTGSGSNRQQWLTYRDAETYRNIVQKGVLYPLNSLMYHGICIADNGIPSKMELNDKDIADEIWSFFSSGTSLQELYINPHKLSSKNWDCLAHAIQWAKKNEKTLVDVHWVGGDPYKGDVYGRASWSSQKAIISLRNPSAEIKQFHVNVAQLMELPMGASRVYSFHYPEFFNNGNVEYLKVKEFDLTLQPYEVVILEGVPVK